MTFESLRNLNASTAKHAQWLVRILLPRCINYSFKAREELVHATKFSCLLVAEDPHSYLPATVAWSFSDREGPSRALERFPAGSVWIMRKPVFDPRADSRYFSSSVPGVLLLNSCVLEPVPNGQPLAAVPADHLEVGLSLKKLMECLTAMRMPGGQKKVATKNVDICGKILEKGLVKEVTKDGKTREVCEVLLADASGAKITVSVWDKAISYLEDLEVDSGVSLVGVSAMKGEGNQIKLNMWDSAFVCLEGAQVQSLTDLGVDTASLQTMTAAFVPGAFQPDVSALSRIGIAVPTVCVDLAEQVSAFADVVFQVNRATFAFVPDAAAIWHPKGQLRLVPARLHDATGCVDVLVTEDALPPLLGFNSCEELKAAIIAGKPLHLNRDRFNVRGLLRSEQWLSQQSSQSSQSAAPGPLLKKYIASVELSSLNARVSASAVQQMVGLNPVSSGLVLPVPAGRLANHDLLGMTVAGWNQTLPDVPTLSLHRALLLVEGTTQSKIKPLGSDGSQSMEEQSFQVTSTDVICLLSKQKKHEMKLTLTGYCSFNEMLAFKLDNDKALVIVSSWQTGAVGTQPVAIIEHITKAPAAFWTLVASLEAEFSAIVRDTPVQDFTGYPPLKKLKRLASEPAGPLEDV